LILPRGCVPNSAGRVWLGEGFEPHAARIMASGSRRASSCPSARSHRRASRVVLLNLVAFVVTDERPGQGVRRGGKWVGHGDTTPREALVQILRE
jgi:hypothetical protein